MQTKSFSFANTQISYTLRGEGEPVLLLHGFAEDSRIWDGLATSLSKEFRVITPDIPGSGQSGLLDDKDAGMTGYAAVLNALLETENITACTLIGHSMGGYIALAFAEEFPQKLKALGLFHSSAYADDAAKIETRKKGIGFIKENGAAAFLKTSIPGLFADAENSKNDIEDLIAKGRDFTNKALVQYYESMIDRPDRTAVLKNLDIPILFLMGQHDKAVPFEHSLQQSHLPNISHIHILRNAAHMGMLEQPEESFADLAHFLHAVYV
jgi:pimeloyl-ACP methyl ester carboxylesterase